MGVPAAAMAEEVGPAARLSRSDPGPVPPGSPVSVPGGAGRPLLPVLPGLAALLPGGGLRPGSAVCVEHDRALLLALAAGASARGAWCAAVGLPDLGVLAAAGYGFDLERLLLVDEPGGQWPEVVAALAGGVEVVLLRPPEPPPGGIVRRLSAVLRRTGAVLLVAGDWAGAQLRLRVEEPRWTGLGNGHGQLGGRSVRVVAEGRGPAARAAGVRLWLPDARGGADAADGPPRGTEGVIGGGRMQRVR